MRHAVRFAALSWLMFVALFVISYVPAGAQTSPIRGIWFTDAELPPGGMFNRPAEFHFPRTDPPIFEKTSGRPVKLIVVFWGGDSHEIVVQRTAPDGKVTTTKWNVDPRPRDKATNWRLTHRTWSMDRLAVGDHVMNVSVDGKDVGRHTLTIR